MREGEPKGIKVLQGEELDVQLGNVIQTIPEIQSERKALIPVIPTKDRDADQAATDDGGQQVGELLGSKESERWAVLYPAQTNDDKPKHRACQRRHLLKKNG